MKLVNQSKATIQQFSIGHLVSLPSTLDGEQFPLNTKVVDSIYEDLYNGKPLLTMPELTLYENNYILTGGRHRIAAEALNYDGENLDELFMDVLVYEASSALDVLDRVLSNNGGRRMVSGEKKTLAISAKYGFSALDADELLVKVTQPDLSYDAVKDLLVTSLAMKMEAQYEWGNNGNSALVIARSFITAVSKYTVTTEVPAVLDADGVKLTAAKKIKASPFMEQLTGTCDDISYMLDTIAEFIDVARVNAVHVAPKDYLAAVSNGLGMVHDNVPVNEQGIYATPVTMGSAPQRNVGKYMKLIGGSLKVYFLANVPGQ
jgi:hypothetical protein